MGEINELNLYMYCKDNPVMYDDPSGCFPNTTNETYDFFLSVFDFAIAFSLGTYYDSKIYCDEFNVKCSYKTKPILKPLNG